MKTMCLYAAERLSGSINQINPSVLSDDKWDDIMNVGYLENMDTEAIWKNLLGKGLQDR